PQRRRRRVAARVPRHQGGLPAHRRRRRRPHLRGGGREGGRLVPQKTGAEALNRRRRSLFGNVEGGSFMERPCPVPLQAPWSPVGYQVVEVAEEYVPGRSDNPPTSHPMREGKRPE